VVGDEADGDADDVRDALGGERCDVILDLRPEPRLGRASGGLEAPRPTVGVESSVLGDEPGGLAQLLVVGIAGREDPHRQAVRAEDDVHAIALPLRPAREAVPHPRRERLDQEWPIVIALDVLERDLPAVQIQSRCDLVAVFRDGERAVMRREHHADRVRDAVLEHLADDLLDPRRPVPHAEITAVVLRVELSLKGVDLAAGDLGQRRAAPDQLVVVGDLFEHLPAGRPP
jgi:hypothetical protein